ncbi:histidine phosphatase family protein [Listeria sp. PSOL-1]|uniref:histidine phosphatase family protein n=1 Tax=Listeria sp. PSOL-1 TaxID=1844999 RepID=UPI0013D0F5CF|nr:histidine phosphatase family protein [Listeria sp. PSOL-1]
MKKHIWKIALVALLLLLIAGCGTTSSSKENSAETDKDPVVTIYATRHGKTMLNTTHRAQGWSDTPLTKQGIEVAEYLGKGIKDVDFKAAYSSDSGRAKETARIVLDTKGQKNLKVKASPDLREFCFGTYEGDLDDNMWGDAAKNLGYKTADDLLEQLNKGNITIEQSIAEIVKNDKSGMAEDYTTVRNRSQKKLKQIVENTKKNGGGNVLLVSHGLTIGAMVSDMTDKYKGQQLENASVTKITYKNNKFNVEYVGDTSYVEKGKENREL